jgi:hypothetical protein
MAGYIRVIAMLWADLKITIKAPQERGGWLRRGRRFQFDVFFQIKTRGIECIYDDLIRLDENCLVDFIRRLESSWTAQLL